MTHCAYEEDMSGILVHTLASVTKIVAPVNT